ncbi:hypothetical protein HHI36_020940 [Cryptolaemus montrouzieri]|uniref:dihydrolipoyl dehydrogenase n=1 Tax=Cryptolaemus montrouzieri TaxID=559131 RepID=A0ABD2NCD7_9CUCU
MKILFVFNSLNRRYCGQIFRYDIKSFRRQYSKNEDRVADLAIIGIGPGGLYGALRAKEIGMKHVVVIDKLPTVGGTCINNGCIPSKCLIKFSYNYHQVKSGVFASQGVVTSGLKLDLIKLMSSKSKIVANLSDHMTSILKTSGIDIVRGTAKISGCNKITVETDDGKRRVVEADNIIIATGATNRPFPGIEIDEERIVSTAGVLNLKTVPKRLTVVGAGISAIEMGSAWCHLGSQVTIVSNDSLIGAFKIDEEVRSKYQKILEDQGMKFVMDTKILGAKRSGNVVKVQTEDVRGGKKKEMECDVLLIAVGRIPYTEGLDLERVAIKTNKNGYIQVHPNYQTSTPNFYAVGDVTPGPMTAHKASEDGMTCVDNLCGISAHFDWINIPLVIYTHPEIASIGKTEEELQEEGIPYEVKWCTFNENARARTDLDTTGCIKALFCPHTKMVLGTHIISQHAGEIIHEALIAHQFGITAPQIGRMVHAHPTYAKIYKTIYGR